MPVSGNWTYTTVSGTQCRIDSYNTAGGYVVVIPTTLDTYSVIEVYINALKAKNLTDLTIGHTVELEDECFANNSGLSVTIDANVTTAVASTTPPFESCNIGENLTITNNVTSIPDFLCYTAGLSGTLSLPTTITSIGNFAFRSNNINELTLSCPASLGQECFGYNSGLSLTIDEDVTTPGIGSTSAPFENCAIGDNLIITNNVTELSQYVLAYSGVSSTSFPTSIHTIGTGSFYQADLTTLTLVSSITTISDFAFFSNNISNLTINHVLDLGDNSFSENSGLSLTINEQITVKNVSGTINPPFENCSIGDNLTIGNNMTFVPWYLFASAGISSVSLPTSITQVGRFSFYNNIISALTLPTSISVISESAFELNSISELTLDFAIYLDDECFSQNAGISVTIDTDSIDTSYVLGQDYAPFENCSIGDNLTLTNNVITIPRYLFSTSGLTSLSIPTSVTEIGNFAFYKNQISSLVIPTSVTIISESAFESNTIQNLTLSHAVALDDECFKQNSGISVTIDADIDTTNVLSQTYAPFLNCDIGENVTITSNVSQLNNYLFAGSGMTKVTIVSSVNTIGNSVFRNNTNLSYFKVAGGSVSFGSNILDGNMSATTKGNVLGIFGSNTETWWNANYTGTYNFNGFITIFPTTPNITFSALSATVTSSTEVINFLGVGQYLKIYLNSEHKFTGIINQTSHKKQVEAVGTIFQEVNCTNLNSIPSKRTIKLDYDSGTTASTIVNDMIDDYLSLDGIEAGEISDGVVFDSEWKNDITNIGEVLDECANRSGYQWYIDKDMKLHFHQNPTTISFCTYSIEANQTFSDFREVTVENTIDNYANKIFVLGGNDFHGDLIYTVNGSLTEQNRIQEINCGTGIYNYLHRDSGIQEHDYKYIESGSSSTQINFTAHPMAVGDFFWNITRNAYSFVTSISTDSFLCNSIASQTSGDEIEYYITCNQIGKNELQKRVTTPELITFKSFSNEFYPATMITVSLSDISVSGIYNIDEVSIEDRGNNYFISTVKAVKRANVNDFSTQKNPGYKEFYKDY